jgi:hypothetical protein
VVCKHIYAARITVSRSVTESDGTTTTETVTVKTVKRKTYMQDWPNYNRAQVNKHRHFMRFLTHLCGTLPAPAPKPGRPRIAPSDSSFAAIPKVYSTMSARRFVGDLEEAKDKGAVYEFGIAPMLGCTNTPVHRGVIVQCRGYVYM